MIENKITGLGSQKTDNYIDLISLIVKDIEREFKDTVVFATIKYWKQDVFKAKHGNVKIFYFDTIKLIIPKKHNKNALLKSEDQYGVEIKKVKLIKKKNYFYEHHKNETLIIRIKNPYDSKKEDIEFEIQFRPKRLGVSW